MGGGKETPNCITQAGSASTPPPTLPLIKRLDSTGGYKYHEQPGGSTELKECDITFLFLGLSVTASFKIKLH